MTASSPDLLAPPAGSHSPKPLLASVLNRLQPSPETVVLLLAMVIGGGTGLAVVLFHLLIEKIHILTMENLMGAIGGWGAWTLACVPILGGAIVGLMRWRLGDFGPGISGILSSAQSSGGLSPVRSTGKAVAASVSLGTGASLGPEGPSVEIGANIGVMLGQMLQVSQERLRLLLGAGAAAGLAAGFNAPIAGVFFALEVILGTSFATSAVSLVLLSAVVSALIAQIGQGGQPAFMLPAYEVRSPLELPLYLGLGLFASLVSVAYTQAIQLAQRFFQGQVRGFSWMGQVPAPLKPLLGSACVGLVALLFPQILGIGYETVEAMLRDVQFSLPLLGELLVVKLIMTALSLGSGLVGGLFAPAMFLGASLGAAYGKALALLLPLLPLGDVLPLGADSIAAPPAYAMVGMAAVLAASARAPLTAILLLFELTRDYRIILPLMAAVGLSVWLVDRLKPVVTPTTATQQPTGLNVKPDQSSEFLNTLSVRQAMHQEFLRLSASQSVLQAGLALLRQQSHSAMVVDENESLVGIVTLQDINRAIARWEQPTLSESDSPMVITPSLNQCLSDICTQDILCAYDDESIADALTRMAARGLRQLPVVDRDNPHHVLGLLDQERIELACSLAVTRDVLKPHVKAFLVPEAQTPLTKKTA